MYQAKRGGRGRRVTYRDTMDAGALVVEEAESVLRVPADP